MLAQSRPATLSCGARHTSQSELVGSKVWPHSQMAPPPVSIADERRHSPSAGDGPRMDEKHPEIVQVFQHVWPTDEWPFALLAVRLETIAANNGLAIQNWEEDGLGQQTGCGFRLRSGTIVHLVQAQPLISSGRHRGPAVYADAGEVLALGVAALVAEMLSALGLNPGDVEWQNQAPSATLVSSLRQAAEERRQEAASTAAPPSPLADP